MRLLIVEDEALLAKRIERLSREILGKRLEKVDVRPSLESARAYIHEFPIDLLMLDLNLNGKDGFYLLKESVAGAFHTLIISAYTDKAIQAYDYGVLDFIPKPFNQERLAKAFDRFENAHYQATPPLRFIACKTKKRISLLKIEEISFIRGADHYSEIHTLSGKIKLHDKSLQQLQTLLPSNFVRIHKSYIANLDSATQILIEGGGRYGLQLTNQEIIPVSRSRYSMVRAHFS
ncbi:MAG: DNA-binding response regulator [Saprospiraceae bacterium]|nr:MAG: DNA-binding response regulator [Saprospiraceae bacterium]